MKCTWQQIHVDLTCHFVQDVFVIESKLVLLGIRRSQKPIICRKQKKYLKQETKPLKYQLYVRYNDIITPQPWIYRTLKAAADILEITDALKSAYNYTWIWTWWVCHELRDQHAPLYNVESGVRRSKLWQLADITTNRHVSSFLRRNITNKRRGNHLPAFNSFFAFDFRVRVRSDNFR